MSVFGKTVFCVIAVMGVNLPLFASGIAANDNSPMCDYGTLESYTGPVGLQAEYEANTINLHWYNQDQEITVQVAAQTCSYDGVLHLPTEKPTRAGYQFDGWTLQTSSE